MQSLSHPRIQRLSQITITSHIPITTHAENTTEHAAEMIERKQEVFTLINLSQCHTNTVYQ